MGHFFAVLSVLFGARASYAVRFTDLTRRPPLPPPPLLLGIITKFFDVVHTDLQTADAWKRTALPWHV